MGLRITHDCWNGPYSGFKYWRGLIAQAAGIPLGLMEGFFDPRVEAPEEIARWLPVAWSVLKPDVLHVLLNHPDHEGSIESRYCGPLADRLEALLPLLPEGEEQDVTRRFIVGLRQAANRGEEVEFR
jgi:hypothetical protein